MEFYVPEQPFPFEPQSEDPFQTVEDGVVVKVEVTDALIRQQDDVTLIRVLDNNTIERGP